jgi:hypothetical protein
MLLSLRCTVSGRNILPVNTADDLELFRAKGYLQHDQDRTVFIDIDLHHGMSLRVLKHR